jgi:GNAT superfamily N-acetyltransferase
MNRKNKLPAIDPSEILFREEVTGAYSGQVDCVLSAYQKDASGQAVGSALGALSYTVYLKEPSISFIEVREDCQRRGLGEQLIVKLQEQYPTKPISWGMIASESGSKLFDRVPKKMVPNPLFVEISEKLAQLRARFAELSTDRSQNLHEYYDVEGEIEDYEHSLQFTNEYECFHVPSQCGFNKYIEVNGLEIDFEDYLSFKQSNNPHIEQASESDQFLQPAI